MDNIFVLPDYPGITFSVNKKSFVDDSAPIEMICVNRSQWHDSALEYKNDEDLKQRSLEEMKYYRNYKENH